MMRRIIVDGRNTGALDALLILRPKLRLPYRELQALAVL
jgi:hypothetical protein